MRQIIVVLCVVLLAAGCGTSSQEPAAADGSTVTLPNCGQDLQLTKPPERVVSLNQGSTEILLSLGLADRIVGTATWTDPILPELKQANAKVPRLADNAPSYEAVLKAEPDLVTASFSSIYTKGGVAPRDQFEKVGVATYLSPTDCEGKVADGGDGTRTTPFTMDLVYAEITDLATMFDVQERGRQLIASLKKRQAAAATTINASGVTALFWFANAESPYMAGCCGAPGAIATPLRLKNVFDDTTQEWPQVSWETVVARDPDVLVIGDLTRRSETAETAQAKIQALERGAATRQMTAVRKKRYITLPGGAMNPSIRTVNGMESVADGLRELGLGR